jgi:hypothetical protein
MSAPVYAWRLAICGVRIIKMGSYTLITEIVTMRTRRISDLPVFLVDECK